MNSSAEGIRLMLKNLLHQGKEKFNQLKNEALKYKSKEFLEASLAGSALIAIADGSIDADEKQKMMNFIESNEALSVYEARDVINTFDKYIQALEADKDAGKAKAYQAIRRIRNNTEQARLLIRMVIAIAAADGNFDNDERTVANHIATELDLSPAEFDLA